MKRVSPNYLNALNVKKKMLLVYFYKRRDGAFFRIRKNLIKNTELPVEPFSYFGWEMKHLMLDMGVFNTEYSGFKNYGFFEFFGVLFKQPFDSIDDSVYYKDPYRIY
jgi:hypothetical protein